MKRIIIIGVVICFALAFNTKLKIVTYTLEDEKIDKPIKLVFISDLHGCNYGLKQRNLLDPIDSIKPDAVLLGGDIYDGILSENVTDVLEGIRDYPVFYVTGNHEIWSGDYILFIEELESYGVKILAGASETLNIRGQEIQIAGVDDPSVASSYQMDTTMTKQLESLHVDEDLYTILLAHRPEEIHRYNNYGFDLVLSGHAHGGQWRIPFLINGVLAPNQGFFPKYAGGYYKEERLIVGRGLAKETTRVPRIFNRPELLVINIK